MSNRPSELSYLDAAHVTSPAGALSELDLVTADGEQLGSIAGVVIEAAAGRARYLEVRSADWSRPRRYLVEADQLAQVDTARRQLRLVSGNVAELQPTANLRKFSDDDLIAAMFARRAS